MLSLSLSLSLSICVSAPSTMATSDTFLKTPTKTPTNDKMYSSSVSRKQHHQTTVSSSSSKPRFEAYNRLQGAGVAFGEKLSIPEIVALGGQSDGKSTLLGFRFNVREVEMGTRMPLILQMVHDPTALDPRCQFQDEDSEEYGSPIVLASAIADTIKSRTDVLLKKTKTAVSSKPIVMRAEYAHCPNFTIIDTPGFVLKLLMLLVDFSWNGGLSSRRYLLQGQMKNILRLLQLT